MIAIRHLRRPLALAMTIRGLIFLSLAALLISPSTGYTAFPGTNGKIAFDTNRDGNEEIYVMNPDGSGLTRLTFSSGADGYPTWSADGTRIAFDSNRDGNHEIYMMNADGSGQTNLTNNSSNDVNATFSPDGSKIAFNSFRDGNGEIYVMNSDGTAQTRLTNDPAGDGQPAWSPDGTKIAFDSERSGLSQIFVMNADGTNVVQLTGTYRNGGADWSPDGTRIAFHSDRDCSGCGTYYDIYVMNADGTGQTRLAFDPVYATSPAWSPDGAKIVFESQRNGNYEVYVMNADGTEQTNLTNNAAVDFRADFGPAPAEPYDFTGFFQPVDNLPTLNAVNAGRAIPVKFSLNGDQGLDIFASGYPKSQKIACDSSATVDGIEETVTAGSSSLSYDLSTDTYIYVWKTERTWAGTCRQLILKLDDGTFHRANFRFR